MSTYVIVQRYIRETKINRFKPKTCRIPTTSAFSLKDDEFKKKYLLSKADVKRLRRLLWHELEPRSGIKLAISGEMKLMCGLYYFATGFLQKRIAQETTLNLSQSAVCRSVVKVSAAISKVLLNRIAFPRPHQYDKVKASFNDVGGFPGVIGVIACHHFPINTPSDNETGSSPQHAYLNPNGQYSLNVLLVCDANMKITYVNAQYPGATMDWFLWKHSNLRFLMEKEFSKGNCDSWLLGTNNFQPEPWLLTPIKEPMTVEENTYNLCHERTIKIAEDCVRLLRARFRVLTSSLRHDPITAEHIINSCVVLHNMSLEEHDDSDLFLFEDEEDEYCASQGKSESTYVPIDATTNDAALSLRSKVVESYFS